MLSESQFLRIKSTIFIICNEVWKVGFPQTLHVYVLVVGILAVNPGLVDFFPRTHFVGSNCL